MKIASITVCKNEMHVLPFFMRHYQPFIDEMVFFDNGSTDGTVEYIDSFANTRVIHFSTLGYQREEILTFIRNNAYQELQLNADWYFMVDADEFICHPNIREYLKDCLDNHITLPRVIGYYMHAAEYPRDDGSTPITDLSRYGMCCLIYMRKLAVVSPKVQIRYNWGAHTANPQGDVKFSEKADLKLLHYNTGGFWHHLSDEQIWTKRNKKFHWFSYEKIQKRSLWGASRGSYVWTKDETLAYSMPVFHDEFEEYIGKHIQKANEWHPDSFHQLGVASHLGHNVPRDFEKAASFFQKGAKLGNKYSQYYLGVAYAHGKYGLNQNRELALEYLMKSSKQDHSHARFEAALLLQQKNALVEAKELLEKAAGAGVCDAAFELSILYNKPGTGFTNAEQVNYWRRVSAEAHTAAMYNEAVHHYNNKNFNEAMIWAEKAADRGMTGAYQLMDMILDNRLGLPETVDEASKRFQTHILRKVMDYYRVE